MEKNICRPIIFYNHFLPAVQELHNWEYCAFGTLDGVSVDKRIVSESTGEILLNIWEHQKAFSHILKGKFSAQVVYALCYDDEKKEEEFWQNDAFPFTFFCRLQFRKNLMALRNSKDKLEAKIRTIRDIATMIYTTYDNSDLMIIIKAKYYQAGAGLINVLHQGINFSFDEANICELKNSFTVFAIKQETINATSKEEFCEELNSNKIDSVSVRIIERRCGRIAELCKCIDNQLEKKCKRNTLPILGVDDEVLFFENIGWGDFLKLYRDEKGIFNYSCPIYQKYIAGATTTISTQVNDYSDIFLNCYIEDRANGAQDDLEKENGKKYEEYVRRMRQKVNELERSLQDPGVYKELYMILNALPKFSEEIFSDYVFFAVLGPVNTLLDLLKDGKSDSYYAFIKSFSMYIQNSVKSDRHAMQMMDFNTKMYDVPAKLNAFYTAYIYKVSEILNIKEPNEKKHIYDFLVVPGVTNIVNVRELFQRVSAEKRLLKVEIPENRFYDVCNIMIIFAHEAAHYVGTVLRNRKQRYGYVLESIASIYVSYVRSYCDEDNRLKITASEREWEVAVDRMTQMLQCLLDREINQEYLENKKIGKSEKGKLQAEKLIKNNIRYQEYFSFLKQNLYGTMMDIAQFGIPNVFTGIAYGLNEEEQNKIWSAMQEMSERFLIRYEESTSSIKIDTVLEQLSNLYEESFSDLVSIVLLKLDVKDYLNSIIKENKQQKKDIRTLYRAETIYRITLIINIMCHENTGMGELLNFYEEDEYLEDRCILLSAVEKLTIHIKKGWRECFKPIEYRNCCFYALMDKKIYDKAFNYLLKCQEDLRNRMEEEKENCQKLSDFYLLSKSTRESSVEKQIAVMEQFISGYKDKIFEELY